MATKRRRGVDGAAESTAGTAAPHAKTRRTSVRRAQAAAQNRAKLREAAGAARGEGSAAAALRVSSAAAKAAQSSAVHGSTAAAPRASKPATRGAHRKKAPVGAVRSKSTNGIDRSTAPSSGGAGDGMQRSAAGGQVVRGRVSTASSSASKSEAVSYGAGVARAMAARKSGPAVVGRRSEKAVRFVSHAPGGSSTPPLGAGSAVVMGAGAPPAKAKVVSGIYSMSHGAALGSPSPNSPAGANMAGADKPPGPPQSPFYIPGRGYVLMTQAEFDEYSQKQFEQQLREAEAASLAAQVEDKKRSDAADRELRTRGCIMSSSFRKTSTFVCAEPHRSELFFRIVGQLDRLDAASADFAWLRSCSLPIPKSPRAIAVSVKPMASGLVGLTICGRHKPARLEIVGFEEPNGRYLGGSPLRAGDCLTHINELAVSVSGGVSAALAQAERLLRAAPPSGYHRLRVVRPPPRDPSLLSPCERALLKLRPHLVAIMQLERNAVKWFKEAAEGYIADVMRRAEAAYAGVGHRAAAGGAGASPQLPSTEELKAEQVKRLGRFLEDEVKKLTASLYVTPAAASGSIPGAFEPFAPAAKKHSLEDDGFEIVSDPGDAADDGEAVAVP